MRSMLLTKAGFPLLAATAALLAGCASGEPASIPDDVHLGAAPSRVRGGAPGEPLTFDVDVQPWRFASYDGLAITTPHYKIFASRCSFRGARRPHARSDADHSTQPFTRTAAAARAKASLSFSLGRAPSRAAARTGSTGAGIAVQAWLRRGGPCFGGGAGSLSALRVLLAGFTAWLRACAATAST